MNKSIIRLGILLLLSAQQSYAATSLNTDGGSLLFSGNLVNTPCSIELRSLHQVVVMGQIKSNMLTEPGTWAGATNFRVWLTDCDPTVRNTASVAFTGTPDAQDPQVFKIDGMSNSATDVGIGIFDSQDKLLAPNSAPETWLPLQEGSNALFYTAKYRAVGENVQPGVATASVNFTVLYQ
ncbi:fimbrial protein [Buttiauxella sp. B2]|uniref:fimbrial protein n=1 Tax=Buttiauxella sp. B2 TaxID=2587812 RepID=UPI0011212F27|nr:fimbrial protein [Buttiauxella sp. B2]TNV20489.1 fimbrial protein [Buttiauxella sp. B2]